MPGDGSALLAALALRLKAASNGVPLRTELLRALKAAAGPLVDDVRNEARARLPKAGGLNERVASSPIKVQVRTGIRTAGVRIVAQEHDARSTNFGDVRHPVFGHTDRWVNQVLPAQSVGWFLGSLDKHTPAVTANIVTAMERIAVQIQGLGTL